VITPNPTEPYTPAWIYLGIFVDPPDPAHLPDLQWHTTNPSSSSGWSSSSYGLFYCTSPPT